MAKGLRPNSIRRNSEQSKTRVANNPSIQPSCRDKPKDAPVGMRAYSGPDRNHHVSFLQEVVEVRLPCVRLRARTLVPKVMSQRGADIHAGTVGASNRCMAGMRRGKERVKQQRKGDER